jgi:hypothetical protein
MERVALIDQIQQARGSLEKLLSLLQSAPVERDRFVSHLYQSRRAYRRTCELLANRTNRAVRHREFPDCGEHGLQRGVAAVGRALRVDVNLPFSRRRWLLESVLTAPRIRCASRRYRRRYQDKFLRRWANGSETVRKRKPGQLIAAVNLATFWRFMPLDVA